MWDVCNVGCVACVVCAGRIMCIDIMYWPLVKIDGRCDRPVVSQCQSVHKLIGNKIQVPLFALHEIADICLPLLRCSDGWAIGGDIGCV